MDGASVMSRIAFIDCGSNSFTLVIAEVQDNGWSSLFKSSLPVGLGAGGFRNGVIRPDRFARGLDALTVFKEAMRNYGVQATYATGTSALRDARNASEFVQEAKQRHGISIEVISGSQEAFALWQGILLTEPLRPGERGLAMDIGGGSIEFVLWEQAEEGPNLQWLKSVDAGVVRIKDLAKPTDPLLQSGADRLMPFIEEVLAPIYAVILQSRPSVLVGSSGSFDSMASLLRLGEPPAHPDRSEPLSIQAFRDLHAEAISSTLEERLGWKGLPAARAPYMPLASLLVTQVLEKMECSSDAPVRMTHSPFALREGLVELAIRADLAPSLDDVWPNFNP